MRINEWSVLDSADALLASQQVNLTLPAVKAPICGEIQHQGLICMRARYHQGRHAATGAGGQVFAVWA
jgi:ribosomal protein L32